MKILLVSDSHSNDEDLRIIANRHNNCDYYIHCGDSQSSPERITPFVSVRGNCDYYSSDFQKNIILFSPFGKIYIEHIPFNTINFSKLKKDGFKIYLHGHTHVKKYDIKEGIHIINPGAISYPRDDEASYAIIEVNKDNIEVNFYSIDGEKCNN